MPPKKPAKKKTELVLKNDSPDKIEIYEIRNLTTRKKITIDCAKFDSQSGFKKKITAKFDTLPASLPSETDDIQIKWGAKKGGTGPDKDKYSVKYRAVGGSLSVDEKEKKVTIKGLLDVSKINFSFKGVLEIGPKKKEGEEKTKPPAARLSVRIGNINKLKEWIIDFSHREDKLEGSYINLRALLDWVKEKAPDTEGGEDLPDVETDDDKDKELPIEIVEEDGTKKPAKPEDLIIEFRRLHFNITRKTFHVDVRWLSNEKELVEGVDADITDDPEGEEEKKKQMTFGNFTISDVQLVVTNEPFDYDDKVEDEEEEEEDDEEEEEDEVEDIEIEEEEDEEEDEEDPAAPAK